MKMYRPEFEDEGGAKQHLPTPSLEEFMVLDVPPAQRGWEERLVGGQEQLCLAYENGTCSWRKQLLGDTAAAPCMSLSEGVTRFFKIVTQGFS